MSIISIVNQKGGTGKTTTSINLGSALAQSGKKVLLIDMDAQGNLGYSFGMNGDHTISDVLEGEKTITEVIQQSVEGLDIISSDMRLVDIELSLIDLDERQSVLNSHIDQVKAIYDYILIDCPPSLSILAVNALFASDKVIIPMLMEVLSLQGLDQIVQTIEKINSSYGQSLEVLGILPVMVDKRRKLSEEVKEYINENYDVRIFDSMIRNNVKASEAPSFGQSVVHYAPRSNSAQDYLNFSAEFLRLNE